MIKAIFFDAVGTLIRLTKSVGENYAVVGSHLGLELNPEELDQAFAKVWREMPARAATSHARPDDDKGWWREFVRRVLLHTSVRVAPNDREAFFEAAYAHFAQAGVWELYPEVSEVLAALAPQFQLSILSNFDGRLRTVCRRLTSDHYFTHYFLSSELGADKPDPQIYRRALATSGFAPSEVMHAGDDPERDWAAAAAAGLRVFELRRPGNSLGDLPRLLRTQTNCRKT